jgi:hypothetical protein
MVEYLVIDDLHIPNDGWKFYCSMIFKEKMIFLMLHIFSLYTTNSLDIAIQFIR